MDAEFANEIVTKREPEKNSEIWCGRGGGVGFKAVCLTRDIDQWVESHP